ncbi:MAG: sigma-70 family RNA polymerase sigma factor [bacterium]
MWAQMDDASLIARFREGDQDAFRTLLERYRKPVYAYLARMTGDKSAAEDLFQELFMRFIRNISGYEERGKFTAWLFTSASHLALDYLKKAKRTGFALSLDKSYGEEGRSLGESVKSSESGPEEVLLGAELGERLEEAIGRLSFEQKQVFFMREYSGLTFAEIAAALNVPLGTALARMSRATAKLRNELEKSDALLS